MLTDEEQIRLLISSWMDSTKRGDFDSVLKLMTDDVVFLRGGHPPLIGKAAFAATLPVSADAPRPQFDGSSEIQEIRVLGDWAYVWSQLQVVVTMPNASAQFTRSGPVLSIFRKEGGRWLLARDANMLAKAD